MNSHIQQPGYPQVPEDDPASSPSSSSQDWPPSILLDLHNGRNLNSDLHEDYFSVPRTRRPDLKLKSRRSKSDLAQRPSRVKYDGSTTSRSRHAPSSTSTQALLLITNEQLKQRIITLENEQTRAVTMFAELVQERNSLLKELSDANTKIRMYEVQYEAARREIRNANQIIQRLEEQRADAESNAAKQRKKVRTLLTEKLVNAGWDEGYREGIQEGYHDVVQKRDTILRSDYRDDGGPRLFSRLRKMRGMSPERTGRNMGRRSMNDSDSDDDDDDDDDDHGTSSSAPGGTTSRRGSNASRHRPDSRSSSRHAPPPIRPPSAPPSTRRAPSLGRSMTPRPSVPHHNSEPLPSNRSSPESIHPIITPLPTQVYVLNEPLPQNNSPPDAVLPHTIDPVPYTPANEGFDPGHIQPPPSEVQEEVTDRRNDEPRGRTLETSKDKKPRSRMTSRASTRISEYDLVSPPRGSSTRSNTQRESFQQPNRGTSERPDVTYGTSKQMVEEWRNVVPPDQGSSQENPRTPTPVQSPPQRSPPLRSKTPNQGQHIISPFMSFANRMSSIPHVATSSLRSPRVSGGPRQPREPVRSMTSPPHVNERRSNVPPTSQAVESVQTRMNTTSPPHHNHRVDLLNRGPEHRIAAMSRQPGPSSTSSPAYDSPAAGTARVKTPIAWLRKQFARSYSNPGVPHDYNINVEPPSQSPTTVSNRTTVLDPVLLSPEHANQSIPLPNDIIAAATRGVEVLGPSSTPVPNNITIVLPDDDLPLGFVPMTPVIPQGDVRPSPTRSPTPGEQERTRSPEIFSPVPNNPVLTDPFAIPRPGTAPGTRSEQVKSPRSRALSFGIGRGRWGGTSPDPARPISIFSESDA